MEYERRSVPSGAFSRERTFSTCLLRRNETKPLTDALNDRKNMNCSMEPIEREQVIAKYLSRSLDSDAVEEFEGHYLGCDECFDELRVSEAMVAHLRQSNLLWR